MTRLFATVTALLVMATAARADEEDAAAPEPKAIETAWVLSGAATAAGLALVAAGTSAYDHGARDMGDAMLVSGIAAMVAGPSAGHWYAGTWLTPGLGIRTLAVGALIAGVMECNDRDCDDGDRRLVLLGAGAVWAAGAVYDLATIGQSVRARERRALAVVPVASSERLGVAVTGTW